MSARLASTPRCCAAGLAALLCLLPARAAGAPHYAAIGKQETQRLAARRFAAVEHRFNPKLRAALPTTKLATVWTQVVRQAGPFQRITAIHSLAYDSVHIIVVTVVFAHARLDVRWSVTPQGQIAGLFFAPAATAAKTAGAAPAPIAWRGPQRGYAARPAYAPAGPGTPARPSPADASLGAAPRRLPGAGRPAEFRGLSAPALLPEQMARPPR